MATPHGKLKSFSYEWEYEGQTIITPIDPSQIESVEFEGVDYGARNCRSAFVELMADIDSAAYMATDAVDAMRLAFDSILGIVGNDTGQGEPVYIDPLNDEIKRAKEAQRPADPPLLTSPRDS